MLKLWRMSPHYAPTTTVILQARKKRARFSLSLLLPEKETGQEKPGHAVACPGNLEAVFGLEFAERLQDRFRRCVVPLDPLHGFS